MFCLGKKNSTGKVKTKKNDPKGLKHFAKQRFKDSKISLRKYLSKNMSILIRIVQNT